MNFYNSIIYFLELSLIIQLLLGWGVYFLFFLFIMMNLISVAGIGVCKAIIIRKTKFLVRGSGGDFGGEKRIFR